jgi:hypothetical protein
MNGPKSASGSQFREQTTRPAEGFAPPAVIRIAVSPRAYRAMVGRFTRTSWASAPAANSLSGRPDKERGAP